MAAFKLTIDNLRLGEFDLGGVLYHAHYYHLYETAREAFLRSEGCPYPSLIAKKLHLAIVEAHQTFLAPVRYGDTLEVALSFSELRQTNVRVAYEISAITGAEPKSVHTGWTKLVCVDTSDERFKASRFPEILLKALKKYTEHAI